MFFVQLERRRLQGRLAGGALAREKAECRVSRRLGREEREEKRREREEATRAGKKGGGEKEDWFDSIDLI